LMLTEQISAFGEKIHYRYPAKLLAFFKNSLLEDIAVRLI
jgi:hypothetical protein